MKNIYVVFLIWSSAAGVAFAQDVSTRKITWQAGRVTDTKKSVAWDVNSVFVTSPATIEWTQTSGKYKQVYTFEITGKEGSWNNAAQDGTIAYQVLLHQKPGTITINKVGGVTTLSLKYRSGEQTGLNHEYRIATIE